MVFLSNVERKIADGSAAAPLPVETKRMCCLTKFNGLKLRHVLLRSSRIVQLDCRRPQENIVVLVLGELHLRERRN